MTAIERSNASLLKVTTFFLRLSRGLVVLGAVFALVVLWASLAGVGGLQISSKLAGLDPEDARRVAIVFSIAGLVSAVAVFVALRNLLLIVHSARYGDPFVLENGRRLRQVGFLIVLTNVTLGIAAMVSGLWYHADKGPDNAGISIGFPFSTLLTVLLIFVLASIFEQGARMRAELQATV